MKKKQVWLETDLGYFATKERLIKQRDIITGGEDYGGRFTFHLKGFKDYTVQLTTRGKLGITYPETSHYDIILDQLKPCLIAADNSPAKIIRKKNVGKVKEKWALQSIKSGLGLFDFLDRRAERKRLEEKEEREKGEEEFLELDVEGYALMEELRLKRSEYDEEMSPEKRAKRRRKYREILKGSSSARES